MRRTRVDDEYGSFSVCGDDGARLGDFGEYACVNKSVYRCMRRGRRLLLVLHDFANGAEVRHGFYL